MRKRLRKRVGPAAEARRCSQLRQIFFRFPAARRHARQQETYHAGISLRRHGRHGLQQCLGQPSAALRACAALSQGRVRGAAERAFSLQSRATLNHILIIDWFYVDALEGVSLGPAAWRNPLPCATLSTLAAEQATVDRRLITFCEALSEVSLNGISRVHRGDKVQSERTDRLLLHLFQHQVHHRGQAHAMLSATSVKLPQLDEFFSAGEAPLRAVEFARLGWSEAQIWRS